MSVTYMRTRAVPEFSRQNLTMHHTCKQTHAHICTNTQTHAHIYTNTQTHAHIYTNTQTRTHTHAHTWTNRQTDRQKNNRPYIAPLVQTAHETMGTGSEPSSNQNHWQKLRLLNLSNALNLKSDLHGFYRFQFMSCRIRVWWRIQVELAEFVWF